MQRCKDTSTTSAICIALLTLTLLLPACGSDDDGGDGGTATVVATDTATSQPTEPTPTVDAGGGGTTATATTIPTETATITTPAETATATEEILTTKIAADAGCAITRAWGGSDPAKLTELGACESPVEDWTSIPPNGYVTTDVSGQAWLDFVDNDTKKKCGRIYIFHDGSLQRSPDQPGGLKLKEGTALWRNECSGLLTLATASADVSLEGTDVIVAYLPDEEMSVVIMLGGSVEATPLIELNSDVTGATTSVERGQFWFTTPGEDPGGVEGLDAREPHGFADLPKFIRAMGMESWIATAVDAATSAGIDTGEMFRPSTALLRGGGGVLDDPLVQNAILQRVDEGEWFDQTQELFPEGFSLEGTLFTLIGDQSPVNVERLYPDSPSNPDALEGLPLTLLITDDDTSRKWASLFEEAIRTSEDDEGDPQVDDPGIIWNIEVVSADNALDQFNALAAERPTLWLQRIPQLPPSGSRDTSGPIVPLVEHLPDQPTSEDNVTINVEAYDPESGIRSIVVSLFNDPVDKCDSWSCDFTLGPFKEGTIEYQVVVMNGAGLTTMVPGKLDVVLAEPDLLVDLRLEGEATFDANTDTWRVPVRVVLTNSGTGAAGQFAVTIDSIVGDDRDQVPFVVAGQRNQFAPQTAKPLEAGDIASLVGIVVLDAIDDVALVATADTCIGEEFAPESCFVAESNETNNESAMVPIPAPQ